MEIELEARITDSKPSTSINEFVTTDNLRRKIKNLPSKSYVLQGEEKEEIHKENVDKLDGMTEEEIMEEQRRLVDALDPNIVRFFKSKRRDDVSDAIREETEEVVREEIVEVDEIDTAKEIIEKSDRWLHFDSVETEKLQWMKDVTIPKKKGDNEDYEARYINFFYLLLLILYSYLCAPDTFMIFFTYLRSY